jgi:thiamine pyrophosphokinase
MTGRTALLALDGTLPSVAELETIRADCEILVAADGAAIKLLAGGVLPDIVIGDLDSLAGHRHDLGEHGAVVIEEASQELGDFEKSLLWLTGNGYSAAVIVGIDGGMVDHTLNNFSVLARHARTLALEVRAGEAHGRCVVGRLEIESVAGERISLIPLPSARLTTSGLAWELRDERLAWGEREGASNRATGDRLVVDVHDGVVLLVRYPGARRP